MSFNFKEILTTFMVLFAVIDIVGNIPIIIDLRKKAGHIQSGKASIIAGIIMIIFFVRCAWRLRKQCFSGVADGAKVLQILPLTHIMHIRTRIEAKFDTSRASVAHCTSPFLTTTSSPAKDLTST